MGMEDRDYYWKDRKRREDKFNKKDTYYRPKEFRHPRGRKPGKDPNGWRSNIDMNKQQWKLLLAFFAGGFVTFWVVMIILNTTPDLLLKPYEFAGVLVALF